MYHIRSIFLGFAPEEVYITYLKNASNTQGQRCPAGVCGISRLFYEY
jgi:hypothetical protein